jgi:Flp pilus assembly protein TadG
MITLSPGFLQDFCVGRGTDRRPLTPVSRTEADEAKIMSPGQDADKSKDKRGGGKPGQPRGIAPAAGGPEAVLRKLCHLLKHGGRQEGAAALEFALCLIPLLLIVGGILDYGESWYMQSMLTTASREGARYATRYQTDPVTGQRLLPNNLNPTVEAWVTTNYLGLLPADANLSVTPGGSGYITGTTGAPVSVTAGAQKRWFVLSHFIPTLTNPQPLASTTVMACE